MQVDVDNSYEKDMEPVGAKQLGSSTIGTSSHENGSSTYFQIIKAVLDPRNLYCKEATLSLLGSDCPENTSRRTNKVYTQYELRLLYIGKELTAIATIIAQ